MATLEQLLLPGEAEFLASSFPQYLKFLGTNFPVAVLAFDAGATETAFWKVSAKAYGSGNWTIDYYWYADNASSGDVLWAAQLAAITPNSDSQDIETKAFATQQTVLDTHLGTVGHRLHQCSITLSNLDGVAVGDQCWLKISRLGGDGTDTMANDALLERVVVTFSDT